MATIEGHQGHTRYHERPYSNWSSNRWEHRRQQTLKSLIKLKRCSHMVDLPQLQLQHNQIPSLHECLLFNFHKFHMTRPLKMTLTNSSNLSTFKRPICKPQLSSPCYNKHALANGQIPCCQWKRSNLHMKQHLFKAGKF